jgi:hypothetical protein
MPTAPNFRSELEMRQQCAQTFEIVRRREYIDVRKRGLHSARERLVVRVAEQRVEPDDAPRSPRDYLERLAELRRRTCIPAVADVRSPGLPVPAVPGLPGDGS